MARLPNPGSDDGAWGDILNEFLDVGHNADGTLKITVPSPSDADILANRPVAAPANDDTLFFASDVNGGTLYRSDGSTWTQISQGITQLPVSHTDAQHTDGPNIHASVIDAKGDLIVGTADNTPVRKASGTSGQTLLVDTAQADNLRWVDLTTTVTLSKTGSLIVMSGPVRYYMDENCTIVGVRTSVNTAPTGASIIIDINKNGTTVYTVQANRPTIAVSTNTATANNPDVTSLISGDYLTIDIDQIGSSVAGADLTVQIRLRRA